MMNACKFQNKEEQTGGNKRCRNSIEKPNKKNPNSGDTVSKKKAYIEFLKKLVTFV